MTQKPFREYHNLQGFQSEGRWSTWKKAMVPKDTTSSETYLEKRGPDQEGFMWSNIDDALCEVGGLCGIYEWKATRPDQPDRVVYVGSTCTRNDRCQRLKSRIIRYCKYGNHKEELINDALSKGYELWVRYKQAEDEERAKELENDLLAKYDYAWNIRENNRLREILPQQRG